MEGRLAEENPGQRECSMKKGKVVSLSLSMCVCVCEREREREVFGGRENEGK